MFSRSVAVPEMVPPREMMRTCGNCAGGESRPGGGSGGISCANAGAQQATMSNAATRARRQPMQAPFSVFIEHPLDLERIARFRERQAQQDPRLLRIEIVRGDVALLGSLEIQ